MGVCTIVLIDGLVGVLLAFVGHVGDSFGAAGAVVFELDGEGGCDAVEKALFEFGGESKLGWDRLVWRWKEEFGRRTVRSSWPNS